MGPMSECRPSRNAALRGVPTTRKNGPAGPVFLTAAATQILPSNSTRPANSLAVTGLHQALAVIGEDAEIGPFAAGRRD